MASKKQFCKRGHERSPKNLYKGGACVLCHREWRKKYYEKTSEQSKQYSSAYYKKSIEEDPDKVKLSRKRWKLAQKYGITIEDFFNLLESQDGKCPLCLEELKEPHVDHDHSTGKVRALLCGNCNRGLGMFKENTEVLKRVIEYLSRYKNG